MTPEAIIASLALNITSSAVWAYIEQFLSKNPNATTEELKNAVAGFLNIEGADIYAQKLIQLLAENGHIRISGSHVTGAAISVNAGGTGSFVIKDSSSLNTHSGSKIDVGNGAIIEGNGNAAIDMDDQGNITIGFRKP